MTTCYLGITHNHPHCPLLLGAMANDKEARDRCAQVIRNYDYGKDLLCPECAAQKKLMNRLDQLQVRMAKIKPQPKPNRKPKVHGAYISRFPTPRHKYIKLSLEKEIVNMSN